MTEPHSGRGRLELVRHLAAAFLIAAIFYFVAYRTVEYFRERKGGWQVTFKTDGQGVPELAVAQPWLGISNIHFAFPDARVPSTNFLSRLTFDRPLTNVPFGKVVYLDTTFLPGAIVFDLFGHQIQLLPRVLMLDQREVTWRSDTTYELRATSR